MTGRYRWRVPRVLPVETIDVNSSPTPIVDTVDFEARPYLVDGHRQVWAIVHMSGPMPTRQEFHDAAQGLSARDGIYVDGGASYTIHRRDRWVGIDRRGVR